VATTRKNTSITDGIVVLLWDPINPVQKHCLPTLFIRSMRQLSHHKSAIEVKGGGNSNYFTSAIDPLTSGSVLLPHRHKRKGSLYSDFT
jgi:hypothetical protein